MKRLRSAGAGFVFLAAALLASGCKDFNQTFDNESGRDMTRLIVTVKIKGAPTFPATTGYYNNHPPARADLTGGPDAEGFYTYQLTYIFFPPIKKDDSVHIGLTFAQDQTVELVGYYFTFLNDAERKRLAGLSMAPRHDPQLGLVVDVSVDPTAPGPVTVKKLQWATHTEYIALANLDWTDPVLTILTWENLTADLPFTLDPGEVVTFDVPDAALAGKTHALVRWDAIDGEGLIGQQPVFEMPIPVLVQMAPETPHGHPH